MTYTPCFLQYPGFQLDFFVLHILSPLVVLCKSLSHPKLVLLSDDLIDLHDSVWGPVKETWSSRKMRERTAPSSQPK
ncbi:hypothetical protein ILYODFUR_026619 [Ilyodon furcidens]|uniref:Uncharacterized protein n=1 Tax=Ilyodon furcidens TaxID=33524 RepID=A0ABV0T0F4_9TELE